MSLWYQTRADLGISWVCCGIHYPPHITRCTTCGGILEETCLTKRQGTVKKESVELVKKVQQAHKDAAKSKQRFGEKGEG